MTTFSSSVCTEYRTTMMNRCHITLALAAQKIQVVKSVLCSLASRVKRMGTTHDGSRYPVRFKHSPYAKKEGNPYPYILFLILPLSGTVEWQTRRTPQRTQWILYTCAGQGISGPPSYTRSCVNSVHSSLERPTLQQQRSSRTESKRSSAT